jgi:hypothetical protein
MLARRYLSFESYTVLMFDGVTAAHDDDGKCAVCSLKGDHREGVRIATIFTNLLDTTVGQSVFSKK